jgi:16S rRNA (uracil1498-N3)-methyltransferase
MARGGAASVIPRRAPVPNVLPGERRLEGPTAHYLSRVLRLRAGDPFTAFDPTAARESDGMVIRVDGSAVDVRLGPVREGAVRAQRSLTWVQGLAKGDKCDAVVRDATELGASRVVLSATRRSVLRLEPARALSRRLRWSKIAEQAARQCGRSDAPEVLACPSWEDAIVSCADVEARFCLWNGATEPLAPQLLAALARGASLAFACGAEGGLDESEIRLAVAGGWTAASLGPFTLRTETVAAAVLGAVLIWTDSFDRVAPAHKMLK